MALSPISSGSGLLSDIVALRSQLNDLQRQMATGKKSETYGGLGNDRLLALSLRARVSAVDGYQSAIALAKLRLDLVQQNLGRLEEIVGETRTDTLNSTLTFASADQSQVQITAGDRLIEAIGLLNFEIAGRHLFAGRDTADAPVVSADRILNGDGPGAGLKQIIAERLLADLGADGRGRLVVGPAVGATVSLAEDAAPSPFGFKLAGITGTVTGTSFSGPTGSPQSLSVTFSATLPQPGETVRLTFALPDGSQEILELEATTTAPPGAGQFLIGADADATAANFNTALAASLETLAATSLRAASAMAASDDFFNFDATTPPQRVSGPPFETATALVNATASDTVRWYQGDISSLPARDSAIARIDDNLSVAYGVRANEGPLRTAIASLAVLAAETFDTADTREPARYVALTTRVSAQVSFPSTNQSVLDLIGELGFKQSALQKADERHGDSKLFTQTLLDKTENADINEVGVMLLSLQTRLQASFQTTATLSRLSLVNFI